MEADAIKSKDVVYQQLRLRMAADSSLDAYVHEYSTAAAELMLVTAINQQKVSARLVKKTAAAVLAMVVRGSSASLLAVICELVLVTASSWHKNSTGCSQLLHSLRVPQVHPRASTWSCSSLSITNVACKPPAAPHQRRNGKRSCRPLQCIAQPYTTNSLLNAISCKS